MKLFNQLLLMKLKVTVVLLCVRQHNTNISETFLTLIE